MRTNAGVDPHAEERADISFMQTLMRGHADAAWAMVEMKTVVHAKGRGGFTAAVVDAHLARAARQLRAAADHMDRARRRIP